MFFNLLQNFYRPQRSCGQGNIFTPVCHSVHRGVSSRENSPAREPPRSARENPPCLPGRTPPRTRQTTPPLDQADHPPGPGRPPLPGPGRPPGLARPPPPPTRGTPIPPGKQTSAYGQRAAGTHPTGMHSCKLLCILCLQMIYDGEGTVIQWIIVTDGSVLTDDITTSGEFDVLFLKTSNGSINATAVKNAMIMISRYVKIQLIRMCQQHG